MTIISASYCFAPIGWWLRVVKAQTVLIDKDEAFVKMTPRNRYCISGPNNPIMLSIPLDKGRNQQGSIRDIKIKNEYKWQVQHWRTLVSVYNKSPFFFHYKDSLSTLYQKEFRYLIDFNDAATAWLLQQLPQTFLIDDLDIPSEPAITATLDLRQSKNLQTITPEYHQIFSDRIGFLPNLSILDLLFSEGPGSQNMLNVNAIEL